MRGLNKVTLIGNLGKDPEVQVLDGNVPVAKFSLATTETWRDKAGQLHSSTDWHTVVLWRAWPSWPRPTYAKAAWCTWKAS
jgi:single-strand DNA-binding protein